MSVAGRNASVVIIAGLLACHLLVSCVSARGRRGGVSDIPGPGEIIFDVLQHGAQPNDKFDSSQGFMKAWTAACHSGTKARVLIPPGDFKAGPVVFAGPCNTVGPIVVQILGNIKATTDITDYTDSDWILFESIMGLRVIGGGTLDGQGSAVWKYDDCKNNAGCSLLPANIKFQKVTDAIIRGIKSINSKAFHIFITNCNNIRAHKLFLIAPEDSPNTDGVHISESTSVKVSKSIIRTGDDCISVLKGSVGVIINKIFCGPGHGISIGSLGKYSHERDVRGVIVKNSTLTGTTNGIRIKTWPASEVSSASGLLFQDIIMNNVRNPIIIDQQYGCSADCKKEPSKVQLSNIVYRNIRGTTLSPEAVSLKCSQNAPCKNMQLFDIDLKYTGAPPKGPLPAAATCQNAELVFGGIQNPPSCRI